MESPTVSVLMPAYNYADYISRAITSALEQDYPEDRLHVIVVDDGSTDETASVVAELARSHPGRVELISQPNSGPSAAINRALDAATGELIAILDADDAWLPEKTRRQVEVLNADPEVGMVFCDMVVVDGDEQLVRPSQVGQVAVLPSDAFARLLCQNIATQSSIMLRRELARPIPAGIPYSDWWFALRAAEVSRVEFIREPLALYREHGANLTSGVSGAAGVREHRKEIAFQLWALRNLDLTRLSPDEVEMVWGGVEEHARRALTMAGSHFVELAEASDEDREQARALRAEAQAAAAAGDLQRECVLLLRALAHDPFEVGARPALAEAVARAKAAAQLPDPLTSTREVVVLTAAADLLAGDAMLESYAQAMAGLGRVTLAIDASEMEDGDAAGALGSLVERCGLSERDDIHMVAVVGELDPAQRHRLHSGSAALYARSAGAEGRASALPVFTPETVAELRALVDSL